MSDKKYSLFDYAHFIVTVLLGVLAIVVTVKVSRSADDIGRSSLYVATVRIATDSRPRATFRSEKTVLLTGSKSWKN